MIRNLLGLGWSRSPPSCDLINLSKTTISSWECSLLDWTAFTDRQLIPKQTQTHLLSLSLSLSDGPVYRYKLMSLTPIDDTVYTILFSSNLRQNSKTAFDCRSGLAKGRAIGHWQNPIESHFCSMNSECAFGKKHNLFQRKKHSLRKLINYLRELPIAKEIIISTNKIGMTTACDKYD